MKKRSGRMFRPSKRRQRLRRSACIATAALAAITPAVVATGAEAEEPAVTKAKVDLTAVSLERLMDFKVQSVYGASKHEQKVSEAPSSVTIIDSDEIKKLGHRNLGEVLNSVAGIYVTYDRNYSYLGIRGFNRPGDYVSRVLVLVDGHRMNENVFDSVLIGNDFVLDVDLIDRVEVIRGPSSSIYGNNAFFGVINVITRKGRLINGMEVSASAGSFDSYKARASYGKKFQNDIEMLVSGSFYDSDGPAKLFYPQYNVPGNDVNNGITEHTDYERFYKAFASVSYHDLTLEGAYSWREKGIPTGSYGTIFNDDRANTIEERGYIDLKYHHTFDHDLELTARTAYDFTYYAGDYPIIYPGDVDVLYEDYARGTWWSGEVQLTKKLFDRHTATLGTEFHNNVEQDQGNKDNFVPRTVYNDHRESFNYAFYAQGEAQILTNLILNAGLRYDQFETFGETINPRVALIYSPLPETTFKALYGTAFKAPNVYELYYTGASNKGNTDLDPETIDTYELVYEQGITKRVQCRVSGFYYKIDGLINQTTDPNDGLLVYRNMETASAHGVEFEADARFGGGLRGRASYTFQEAKDDETGAWLSNSPKHLAKLGLIVPVYSDKVFSGFEILYSSRAKTLSGGEADSYWMANVTLFSHELIKNLEASLSVYNVFNQGYGYPGGGEHLQDTIRQDGRTWRFKLTYRF